jgi:hypothetical protein
VLDRGDRPDGELGLPGCAELAYHEHRQLRVQESGDRNRDGYATAREREDQWPVVITIMISEDADQLIGQRAASSGPVLVRSTVIHDQRDS